MRAVSKIHQDDRKESVWRPGCLRSRGQGAHEKVTCILWPIWWEQTRQMEQCMKSMRQQCLGRGRGCTEWASITFPNLHNRPVKEVQHQETEAPEASVSCLTSHRANPCTQTNSTRKHALSHTLSNWLTYLLAYNYGISLASPWLYPSLPLPLLPVM